MTKAVTVLLAVALLAGCGGKSKSAATTTTAASTGKTYRVGLITDIGQLNDRGFNHLAYVGLQRAGAELGVKTRVIQSASTGQYIPNLSALARQGYDLVIGVGYTEIDAIGKVAKQFPKTKFAIVDVSNADLAGKPKNVEGLLFHEEQVGYLAGVNAFVGAAAALYHRDRTGESQLVDVSELESIAEIAGPALLVATYEGQAQPRHEPDYLRGPIACKDGYVFVYFGRGEFWRDAMNALGLPELAEDQRFAQARYRRQHRDEISSRIAEQVRTRGKWELFDALNAVRCIVGVVQDTRDVVESEHLAARGFFVDLNAAGKDGVNAGVEVRDVHGTISAVGNVSPIDLPTPQ